MRQTFFALLLLLALFSSVAVAQSGTWSNFHACSVGCGGGTTYRDCILNGQQVDYSNCPGGAAASVSECNTVPCGTIIGTWSAIHACDRDCMTYRDCIVNGAIADNSFCEGESVQVCTIPPCNIVVFPGVWSGFSNCSRTDNTTCGSGTQTRDCLVNDVVSDFTNCEGGSSASTRNCSTCTGTWSDWFGCTVGDDATCGTGFQTRDCLIDGVISDLINCEGGAAAANRSCPVCTGTWSDWFGCTAGGNSTCGSGFQTRDCLIDGVISDLINCEGGAAAANRSCPVCAGVWSDWFGCSVSDNATCATGFQTRDCLVNGTISDLINCEGGAAAANRTCPACPGVWSDWFGCTVGDDAPCGSGFQTRDCLVDGVISDLINCEGGAAAANRSCPGCAGTWSDWFGCTVGGNATCGSGFQTRDCLINGEIADLANCEGGAAAANRSCPACAGVWSDWFGCTVGDDATCATGFQTRDCLVNGTISDLIDCEGGAAAANRSCPVCAGVWSDWFGCTVGDDAPCGTGFQTRDCLISGVISDLINCEGGAAAANRSCPLCAGTWSDWFGCTVGDNATCASGFQTRDCLINGEIADLANCQGGSAAANRTCPPCAGVWSNWFGCTVGDDAPCASGFQTRDCLIGGVISDLVNCEGGSAAANRTCPPCDTFASITPGTFVGVWGAFHACSLSCGNGTTYRDCLVNGAIQRNNSLCQGGGAASTRPCNTQPCGSSSSTGVASSSTGDIVFAGVWSSVHACPVSCGGGTTYRDCLVDGQQADYSNCEGESTRPCNTQAC